MKTGSLEMDRSYGATIVGKGWRDEARAQSGERGFGKYLAETAIC
jgi:hypothetical protein